MSAATWSTSRPYHVEASYECPDGCLFLSDGPDPQELAAVKVFWRAHRFSDGSARLSVEAWATSESPHSLRMWVLDDDDRTPRSYCGDLPEWMPPVPGWLLDVVTQMRTAA